MSNYRSPRSLVVSLSILILAALATAATKRPLNHRDYDHWRTIATQALSSDGKFLVYSLFPEEGDGEIIVRNLASGKETHEPAGSVPSTPDAGAEEPAAGPPVARGARFSFTSDNHYLVSSTFPSKSDIDQAKKDKKPAPHGGMIIVELASAKVTRIPDVASFQVAEKGESFLAYLKEPKPSAATPDPAAEKDNNDQDQRRAGGGRGGAAATRKFGSDLILRDLRVPSGNEQTYADVVEYSLSKDAKLLVYDVGSRKEETNGLYSVTPGTSTAPATLLVGKGRYTKLTWDRDQHELVFFSDRDDTSGKPAKYKLYGWTRGSAAPSALISSATPGFHSGFLVFDRGPVSFSRDGSRVFVSCAPASVIEAAEAPPTPAAVPTADSDKVLADLWRWNDDYIQPMQKVRAAQERARSYRAVYSFTDKKFIQLADPTMNTVATSDGRFAVGTDDRAYRKMVDYDGNYSDLYIVDTNTGDRKLALKSFPSGGGRGGGAALSPDGSHLLWYHDKQWWAMSVPDGKPVDLTANANSTFFNEEHDSPDAIPAYGNGGWTKDGKQVFLYDRHDVWAFTPDTGTATRLTNGTSANLQFRIVQLDRGDEEEERGIDPAKPLLLRAENLDTRDTGFFSLPNAQPGTPKKLIMGPKNYRAVLKAKDANVVLMTESSFHEEPNLFITDSAFDSPKKVTTANPQQADLLWGSGEMMTYRNDDGVQLQAALYKPDNFDPKKKYPMIIYIYERLSQNLNTFVKPAPGHSINIAYYVSNGYLVLTPDIIYTTGHPGQSAVKCVLPAIQAVVERGYVDRAHIGFQGHSWGGYQGAYLLTQTNLFAAAETGAPVANMISAYDGIRWGTGLPRQFQYEKTQSRIGGTPWEKPLLYIENSPIFMLDRVSTPVMIIANDGDDAVPWYQGIEMFLGLRRLGKEAYLFNYNGEPHHLNRRPNQKDYTLRMSQFFDHYLKGAPAPEWMEKGVPYIDREKEKERFNTPVSEGADHKP